jgi:hypothetical protein
MQPAVPEAPGEQPIANIVLFSYLRHHPVRLLKRLAKARLAIPKQITVATFNNVP